MVLGHDINMDRVASLCSQAFVGILEYISLNMMDLLKWVCNSWKPLLGYFPNVSMLVDMCLCFL